jgi:hypothetical protein
VQVPRKLEACIGVADRKGAWYSERIKIVYKCKEAVAYFSECSGNEAVVSSNSEYDVNQRERSDNFKIEL